MDVGYQPRSGRDLSSGGGPGGGEARGSISIKPLRILGMGVSPETSSQNGHVGGYRLRRLMLKMSVSPETSSQNGDVEIAGLIQEVRKWSSRLRHPRKNGMSKKLLQDLLC